MLDIPDGYYNVCELDEEAFRPLGAELSLHDPTGRLQLSAKKRLGINGGLAKLLGFSLEREPHCRRATSSGHPSGDLRAFCRGQYVAEHPQRSPLHTAEIHPRRERKVWGWSDRVISCLAVQTAGIGASFPTDAHDIRHEWQKYRFRLFECSPTHKKKWLTRVAQGAPGNALGWL